MLKIGKATLLAAAIMAISACSTNYTTSESKGQGTTVLYALSEDEAMKMAHEAILSHFPGRKIEEIKGPSRGYSTYTRVMLDTYSQQVLVRPVSGKDRNGTSVDGYAFDISGSGTSGTGMWRNTSFFEGLQQELNKTGRAVEVSDLQPRVVEVRPVSASVPAEISAEDPYAQIERLKGLYDRGAITKAEFEQKKAELLRRM